MALSNYPYAIPDFKFHKNLLDDVDAADINAIQREVSAIAAVLGVNPHIYTDVALPGATVAVVPPGDGDVTSTISYSPMRQTDPTTKSVEYGTVSDRLNAVNKGLHLHCFRLSGTNISIGTGTMGSPSAVRLAAPIPDFDPFSMYNGGGVVLRKSGFWSITASLLYIRSSAEEVENRGIYQAAIDVDGVWTGAVDRTELSPANFDPAFNLHLEGFYNRGTTISLRTSHTATATQRIQNVSLSGILLREM